MAVTQADLDALVKVYATGLRRAKLGQSENEYEQRSELEARIAGMAAALGVPNPLAGQSTGRVGGIRLIKTVSVKDL